MFRLFEILEIVQYSNDLKITYIDNIERKLELLHEKLHISKWHLSLRQVTLYFHLVVEGHVMDVDRNAFGQDRVFLYQPHTKNHNS